MLGHADDTDHDVHSWMPQVVYGQLLRLVDDEKERADEAPEDELNPRPLASWGRYMRLLVQPAPLALGTPRATQPGGRRFVVSTSDYISFPCPSKQVWSTKPSTGRRRANAPRGGLENMFRMVIHDLGYGQDVSREDHGTLPGLSAAGQRMALSCTPLDGLRFDSCCSPLLRSISGRADDNHHDIRSSMIKSPMGQCWGLWVMG